MKGTSYKRSRLSHWRWKSCREADSTIYFVRCAKCPVATNLEPFNSAKRTASRASISPPPSSSRKDSLIASLWLEIHDLILAGNSEQLKNEQHINTPQMYDVWFKRRKYETSYLRIYRSSVSATVMCSRRGRQVPSCAAAHVWQRPWLNDGTEGENGGWFWLWIIFRSCLTATIWTGYTQAMKNYSRHYFTVP